MAFHKKCNKIKIHHTRDHGEGRRNVSFSAVRKQGHMNETIPVEKNLID